ncbi:MAG: caspase family protein [Prevotella ruminicola]|jgi:hypothetical protein|uniref:Caspase family protein n=1 Tax=Xylanibacter ruminicola TaxID=839 RepID=A0A9D5SB31_XYLRU|nr:caspase family protein [Xylanibacter ruminicola]
MKETSRIILVLALLLMPTFAWAGPKLVKIKLTGTIKEDVEMTVGRSGRKEIISSLPYTFQVAKDELPIRLQFRSNSYHYVDITIPTKPVDEIGHVYLVKVDTNAPLFANNSTQTAITNQQEKVEIKGIDTSQGINKAPYTGKKSENTFALIIANEEYEMAGNVAMATNDGLAVKEYFSKTFGLTDKQILYYPNATFGKMVKAIRDVKSIAQAYNGKINLIVYYAGHGIPDNATKNAYLMPVDADGSDPSVCYSLRRVYDELDAMHLNQCVVLLDACFSGAQRDGDMIIAARGVAIKAKKEKPKGSTIIMSATSDEQTAFSYEEQKHGLFTYFFLKCLQENKGKVTLGELADYISKNVSQQSVLINGKKQTPSIIVPDDMENDWRSRKFTDTK